MNVIGYCKKDEDGNVTEKFFTSSSYDPQQFLDQGYEPYDGPLEEVTYDTLPLEEVQRAERDNLLRTSDWTQLLDAPIPRAKQVKWAISRKKLRDITEQPGFPQDINWPEPPT